MVDSRSEHCVSQLRQTSNAWLPWPPGYPPIRFVLFDLFGTLVESPSRSPRLDELLAECEIAPTTEAYLWLRSGLAQAVLIERLGLDFRTVRDLHLQNRYGSVAEMAASLRGQRGEVADRSLIALTARLFAGMLECAVTAPGALAVVDQLVAAGLRVAIVSNADSESARILEIRGLQDRFDSIVLSCDAGVVKPEQSIFERALSELGATPETALMVGDSWTSDVVGALRIGMRACWLDHGSDPWARDLVAGRFPTPFAVPPACALSVPPHTRAELERWLPISLARIEADWDGQHGSQSLRSALAGVRRISALGDLRDGRLFAC